MKKIMTIGIAIVMVLSMGAVSFAAAGISSKEAVKIALKNAHLTKAKVSNLETDYEKGKHEVEFTKKSNKAEYDYDISKGGKILKKGIDYKYKKDHSKEKIGKDAARKKAAKASGVSFKIVKQGICRYDYDHDDREGSYKVKFKKGNYRYEVEILAPTGAIMEFEKKYRK